MELREDLKYKSFKDVVTLKELHFRARVNALSKTNTVVEAAESLKVVPRTMSTFVTDNNIVKNELSLMRAYYKKKYGK